MTSREELANRIEGMAGLGVLSHIDGSGQTDLNGKLSEDDKAQIVTALRAPAQRPLDGDDVRWAVNVLLEKIAEKFERWDTFDLFRSEAAATVRGFKHSLAVPAQRPSPITDEMVAAGASAMISADTPDGPAYTTLARACLVAALTSTPAEPAQRAPTKAWKDGRLEPCEMPEFIQSLRRHAGWADQEFATRSDAAAHLGERLDAAADALTALTSTDGCRPWQQEPSDDEKIDRAEDFLSTERCGDRP